MTIYEFEATNPKAQSITRNTVIVSLSTMANAIVAREELEALGYQCGAICKPDYDAFETVDEAVQWTKRLLR